MEGDLAHVSERVVLHLINTYLFITGSWVYNQLVMMKRYKPVVFSQIVKNLQVFPFKPVFAMQNAGGLISLSDEILRKLTTQRPWLGQLRRMRGFKPVLLHAHFGDEAYRNLNLKRRLNIPLVTTFYGYDVSYLVRSAVWRQRYKRLFAEGDLFFAEGPFLREMLIALGCPPEKVVVHRLGIDIESLPFRERARPHERPIQLMMAASCKEKKGIIYAIKALALSQYASHLRLTVIGDGELRQSLEEQAHQLGVVDRVTFTGYLAYPDYLKTLVSADIFLSPSVTAIDGDSEGGAPVSLLEAQALGIPVLATYHADIPNVVAPNSAFLVPERNPEALAEAIDRLAQSPDVCWKHMSCSGRQFVKDNHNLAIQIEALQDYYDRLT